MRVRTDNNANYKSVFFNGKTVRQRINPLLPITAPKYAEIEDVAINSKCFANCSYCYTSATKNGTNFDNIVDKAIDIWGSVEMNGRPFQIAIGGAGESTIHPHWVDFVKTVNELGITPNYTTNGMHLSDAILDATEKYCGGVAVSYHPHISSVFNRAIMDLSKINTMLNAHIIIGDEHSIIDLQSIYEQYKNVIKYFVILPYQSKGRAKQIDTSGVWKQTFLWISNLPEHRRKQFAFGALFYEWMLTNNIPLDLNIYEPEIYSGYRIFDDTYKQLRKSSYNLEVK